jgi:hypothetical protein
MKRLEPAKLEAIRLAYVKGDWSIDRIAEAHGVCATSIRNYARQGQWKREVGTTPLKRLRAQLPHMPGLTPEQRRIRSLLKRLYKVLDRKVRLMEQRIALAGGTDATAQSATDAEREMRTLNALTGMLNKLIELEERARASGPGAADGADNGEPENADELRRDLALRIERLNQAGDTG